MCTCLFQLVYQVVAETEKVGVVMERRAGEVYYTMVDVDIPIRDENR